jgi:hypothetical protein
MFLPFALFLSSNNCCIAGEACLEDSPQVNGTCDGGVQSSRLPTCAAVDLPHLAHCGGVAATFADNATALGRCVASTTEQEPLLCMKTSSVTAQCMSRSYWREEHDVSADQEGTVLECSTPARDEEKTTESVCCPRDSVAFLTDDGTQCCPWQVGRRSVEDARPACCPIVDACGVCGGNGTVVDADSTAPHPHNLIEPYNHRLDTETVSKQPLSPRSSWLLFALLHMRGIWIRSLRLPDRVVVQIFHHSCSHVYRPHRCRQAMCSIEQTRMCMRMRMQATTGPLHVCGL